eukprot:TRINITY_DN7517_c0_g2_i2.p1 TRINITY_DN7517_c0_g2~~TRINITY_DN7517_c0_g2_i2.p1  ORF type:complete len:110 (-),score=0.40 TRINITY_DN7517_c0_g2_i2:271-600(-)
MSCRAITCALDMTSLPRCHLPSYSEILATVFGGSLVTWVTKTLPASQGTLRTWWRICGAFLWMYHALRLPLHGTLTMLTWMSRDLSAASATGCSLRDRGQCLPGSTAAD